MSPSVREQLRAIVKEHGSAIGEDVDRCRRLVNEQCDPGRDANLLVTALQAGVPRSLLQDSSDAARARLARELAEKQGLVPALAAWAVESWALALGKAASSDAGLEGVRELVEQGNLIAAIKLYRELKGVGLREAKEAAEALAGRPPSPGGGKGACLIAGLALAALGRVLFALL
jgi:hypothetical protein